MSIPSAAPPSPRRLRETEINGITLVEGIHPDGSMLPWHTHDGPTICFVLRGAFAEYSRGAAIECTPSSLKLTPAGDRHWNRFDRGDVRGLMIEIDPIRCGSAERFGAALSERRQFGAGPEVALARRVHAELCHMDSATPLAHELLHSLPASRLALADIAAEVGVHPATLARGFRRAYGTSLGAM